MRPQTEEEETILRRRRLKKISVEPLSVTLCARRGSFVQTQGLSAWPTRAVTLSAAFSLMFDAAINY